MVDSIKTRIAVRWILRHPAKSESLKLAGSGRVPKSLLVLLPAEEEVARIARHFIRHSGWEKADFIRFICEPEGLQHYSFLGHRLSSWQAADRTRWGILKKESLGQLLPGNSEAVVNLDPDPSAVWVQIVQSQSTGLKIGFDFQGARRLYTVILTAKKGKFVERDYHIIGQLVGNNGLAEEQ